MADCILLTAKVWLPLSFTHTGLYFHKSASKMGEIAVCVNASLHQNARKLDSRMTANIVRINGRTCVYKRKHSQCCNGGWCRVDVVLLRLLTISAVGQVNINKPAATHSLSDDIA